MPRPKGYGKSLRMSRLFGESWIDDASPRRKPKQRPKQDGKTSGPKPTPSAAALRLMRDVAQHPAADGHVRHVLVAPAELTCSRCKARGKFRFAYTHPAAPAATMCSWCFDRGERISRGDGGTS